MNLKFLSLIITLVLAPTLLSAQSNQKAVSGLYVVNVTDGLKLKHETTGDFYFVAPAPFVSTKHLLSAIAKTQTIRTANGTSKKLSVITLKFDAQSTDAIKQATTTTGVDKPKIGLVISGKLESVAQVFGPITNASVDLSFGDYPIEKVQALAKQIEGTR